MCTGQFVYCGHRATLSIGDVPSLRGGLEGTVTCNVELHDGNCGAPPPGHPGTTPSSATATPTMAPEQEAPPTVGRPQRTTARLTMSGTLQYSSSFGGSELFLAKAARTTSSTLDDLQLDITLQIHEWISEFPSLSLALPFLTQEPPQRTNAFGGKEEEVAAHKQAKEWDKNSSPPPYLRKRHNS